MPSGRRKTELVPFSSRRRAEVIPRTAFAGALCVSILVFHSVGALGQSTEPDADETIDWSPGLIGVYAVQGGDEHRRIDPAVAFAWGQGRPDPRLPPGNFRARWTGTVLTFDSGEYRFSVYAAGKVRLSIAGVTLLDAESETPQWHDARPIDLEYGFQPLSIEYERTGREGRLGLCWSGPQFSLEPLGERSLFHDPERSPDGRFARGELLAQALQCGACHGADGNGKVAAGTGGGVKPRRSLARLADNISSRWIVAQMTAASTTEGDPSLDPFKRQMPHFDISPGEAVAIAAWLLKDTPAEAPAPASAPAGDAKSGETLFRTVGCLGCHRVGELGEDGAHGGGDLSHVAAKRPASFFSRWLTDPAAVNPDHQMPQFALSQSEIADLSTYLATLGEAETEPETILGDAELGGRLVEKHRCGACHALPDSNRPAKALDSLHAGSAWDRSCGASSKRKLHQPDFGLTPADGEAIAAYYNLLAVAPDSPVERDRSDSPHVTGRRLFAELNCTGCHARGSSSGLAPRLQDLVATDESLTAMLPALVPPALDSVGDKLHDAALIEAIAVPSTPRRPWLAVRMPRFRLSEEERDALVQFLVTADRVPDRDEPAMPPAVAEAGPRDSDLLLAGRRLVTADGFGCTSCHGIGTVEPVNVALAAHGSNLSEIGARIRRPWFERWVRDPARIVPRMEMPSIRIPVRGVLHDRLDDQLAAVWRVLNEPGFDPPRPNPLRIVRARNAGGLERANVITDLVEANGEVFIMPLAMGLPNRHNVLFDFEQNRLAGWWIGDTAAQRTRGKSWFWEPAGVERLTIGRGVTELRLDVGGESRSPLVVGQFPSEIDSFEHIPGGIRFVQRLRFDGDGSSKPVMLRIAQSFVALPAENGPAGGGFRRRWEIEGAPAGMSLRLVPIGAVTASLDASGGVLNLIDTLGTSSIRINEPKSARWQLSDREPPWLSLDSTVGVAKLICEIDYLTTAPVDRFPGEPLVLAPPRLDRFEPVPGFEAVGLPLPENVMPTGLAWRPDGTLIVASLTGQIWLVRDTNGDGVEDVAAPFSDDLAAPYGVAAAGEAIDAINKYGLVRMRDDDRDGRADRTDVLASGWGHTADYHDWAVGLERDSNGAYYIAFPCQQDDRTREAALLRGHVARLAPREPTADDSRAYSIEPIAGGLRFPMGLALNDAGDLFVTDNQGNYTPFNELNHIVKGARYGFLNKLESQAGLDSPFRPAAIEIPHPWTRSVNGICFLTTPSDVREELGRGLFGPFEGHLIGCEYDTRRLVRMSLEEVDGTYQGAVYPFSLAPIDGEPGFLGPLVCEVGPRGDLYVGNVRDSGWGGGSNTGNVVRLSRKGDLPPGIAEVRLSADGFLIEFTSTIDANKASDPANYSIVAYRREPTPDYGGLDLDRHSVAVRSATASRDDAEVALTVSELREGYVYELHVGPIGSEARGLWPAEAHYTLRRRPPR